MTVQEVRTLVLNLFMEIDGAVPPDLKQPLQDLKTWDSLRHAEWIIRLQTECKVSFSTREIVRCRSCQDWIDLLSQKLL